MATPDQIRRWVNSTRPKNWYGLCAGLTWQSIYYNGGHAPDVYPSAYAAYLAADIESTNPSAAPAGAIHYWDYTGTDWRGQRARWGHVAVDIYGGGHHVLSATGHAHEWWGERAGLITVAAQSARGMPYLGWSRFYGRRNRITINNGSAAGGNARPVPKPIPVPVPEPLEATIMAATVIYTNDTNDKDRRGAIIDTTSGLFSPFGWFGTAYADSIARGFAGNKEATAAPVTSGQFDQVRKDLEKLRAGVTD